MGRVPIHSSRTQCVSIASCAITPVDLDSVNFTDGCLASPMSSSGPARPESHLGIITWTLLTLIAPVIDVADLFRLFGAGT